MTVQPRKEKPVTCHVCQAWIKHKPHSSMKASHKYSVIQNKGQETISMCKGLVQGLVKGGVGSSDFRYNNVIVHKFNIRYKV